MPNVIALSFHVDYWNNGGWHDKFTLNGATDRQRAYVFVAAYLPQASTPVGRGENTGKSLEEFNIVRQFRSIGTWKGQAAVFRAPVQSFPADASRVAVLVQRADQGPIAGSATIALR
jgi:hypothetical protein